MQIDTFFDKFYAHGRLNGFGIVEVLGKIIGSAVTKAPGIRYLPLPTEVKAYSDSIFELARLDVWIDGEKLPIDGFRILNVGAIDIDIKGIFHCFPHAQEPGVMHVQAGAPSVVEVIANLPLLAAGADLSIANFVERPARELVAIAHQPHSIDPCIDGELYYGLSELRAVQGPAVRVLKMVVQER